MHRLEPTNPAVTAVISQALSHYMITQPNVPLYTLSRVMSAKVWININGKIVWLITDFVIRRYDTTQAKFVYVVIHAVMEKKYRKDDHLTFTDLQIKG
ncbi:hypothetical protein AXF42_Ash004049 [Apostasia shenzhenica]|uniref:Uncharacterized protein n=1 Tax=Apostasia shenzhenica TaxID=1088818 RepID=A0A2I0A1T3_9ASPA|nr:hypothetical protein AXF42_Ash004049 [Apostasia shenzhenica]